MLKLDRKLIISISLAATVATGLSACMGEASPSANTKVSSSTKIPSIDGGVRYPVVGDKTGPYYVNTQVAKDTISYGRIATKNEIKAWDKDVMPDGTGLPEGSGSAEDGSDIYDEKCTMCHGDFGSGGGGYPALSKGNAYDLQKTLKNQRNKPDAEGPVRVFGSYWPQASTLFAYIKDGMPHPMTGTLTDDQVYALVAFILDINEIKIDGKLVDDDYVLNRREFLDIKMPNRNGFEPKIDGKNGLKNVRAYYSSAKNFGAQNLHQGAVRCMSNCQKSTAKIVRIKNGGIHDFLPPMSDVRNLPKQKASTSGFDAKKAYQANCAMCHATDAMGAPVFGNKVEWGKIVDQGMKHVYKLATDGINGMPPKGGTDLSDKNFKLVVDYIINSSK